MIRRGKRERTLATKRSNDIDERRRNGRVEAFDQRRVGLVREWNDDVLHPTRARRHEMCNDSAEWPEAPVERKLAEKYRVPERLRRYRTERGKRSHGNGEVERAPSLLQIGRREIDDEPILTEVDPDPRESALHPNATLANRNLSESDELEHGNAPSDLHFDTHGMRVEPDEDRTLCSGQHGPTALRAQCQVSIPCFSALYRRAKVARPISRVAGPGQTPADGEHLR